MFIVKLLFRCNLGITCGTCGACGTCGTNLDTQHREALEPIDQNDTNGVVISVSIIFKLICIIVICRNL